ncbi:Transforming growth factor-beta-induced protein ig-h3 [Paragonimus heterotremus]|uniref:Transforming growth factor-beta-induced protein ig-h3 n=1 Tax=Paragonimus heterotremus TaxID=100268 RepID=A0A8J4SRG8_9TREM|nr:Transforming growth factor-beta-induced protein ig-h3 [Paragonimus heterotremus]
MEIVRRSTIRFVSLSLLVLGVVRSQEYRLGEQFRGLQYADPDSAGYRQCAYWELPDGTHLHADCDPHTMERCGRPAKYQYKCCSGFEEDPRAFNAYRGYQTPKCTRMISPFDECTETVFQSPTYAAFAPALASVSELREEESTQVYTIFAPQSNEDEEVNEPSQALTHVVKGRYYVEELKNGMQLETLDGQRKLYVTKFPYGVTAIDCVELVDADMECQSGVIHKIRRAIGTRNGNGNADSSSVLRFLQTHPETKAFAEDLPPNLKTSLGDVQSGKRYTVLAPRSQAWNSLKQKYQEAKLQKIAATHVLPDQICSGDLIGRTNTKPTVNGDRVNIQCEVDPEDAKENRYVLTECGDRRLLLETDLSAANGVIHLIDEPMVPLSVWTLEDLKNNEQCASRLKITEFVKLLKECDLYMEENIDYAIIVPRDESFVWWSKYKQFEEEYKRFQVDEEYRCEVARYHIVKSEDRLNNMDSFASHTMGHRTNNRDDYLYETTYFKKSPYGSQLYFHYSPIPEMRASEMDGVSLYFTPRINVPPSKNLSEILRERPDTTLTNKKTVESNMETKQFSKNAPKNLYLVTTDDGWKDPRAKPTSASPYRPEFTMYKGELLEQFLLLHHIPLYLWGGDIGYFPPNSVHKFMSSVGVELTFWRDAQGVMRIGHDEMPRDKWPKIVQWNIPARDGIMWLLDGPLTCPDSVCQLLLEDIDFYDMYVSACQTSHLPNEPDAAADFRKKPLDIAARHPDDCTVILQHSETSVNLIEA